MIWNLISIGKVILEDNILTMEISIKKEDFIRKFQPILEKYSSDISDIIIRAILEKTPQKIKRKHSDLSFCLEEISQFNQHRINFVDQQFIKAIQLQLEEIQTHDEKKNFLQFLKILENLVEINNIDWRNDLYLQYLKKFEDIFFRPEIKEVDSLISDEKFDEAYSKFSNILMCENRVTIKGDNFPETSFLDQIKDKLISYYQARILSFKRKAILAAKNGNEKLCESFINQAIEIKESENTTTIQDLLNITIEQMKLEITCELIQFHISQAISFNHTEDDAKILLLFNENINMIRDRLNSKNEKLCNEYIQKWYQYFMEKFEKEFFLPELLKAEDFLHKKQFEECEAIYWNLIKKMDIITNIDYGFTLVEKTQIIFDKFDMLYYEIIQDILQRTKYSRMVKIIEVFTENIKSLKLQWEKIKSIPFKQQVHEELFHVILEMANKLSENLQFENAFLILEKADEFFHSFQINGIYHTPIKELFIYEEKIRKNHIRTMLSNFSSRFSRLQINEIAEESKESPDLIVVVIKDMIANKEIKAKFFESSQSIVFETPTILNALPALSPNPSNSNSLSALFPSTVCANRIIQVGEVFSYEEKQYQIISDFAKGGMGHLYLAKNQENNSQIIIKQLLAHRYHQDRFGENNCEEYWLREQQIIELQSTLSPHTMHLIGALKYEDTFAPEYYLLLEYIDGCSLDLWIQNHFSSISLPQFAHIQMFLEKVILPLALHLQAVHEQGIVHRDITPKNILIQTRNTDFWPVLIDWGVSKIVPLDKIFVAPKPFFTEMNTVATGIHSVGNPPEIIGGHRPIAMSDIYMGGHIIYFFCIGGVCRLNPITLSDYVLSPKMINPNVSSDLDELIKKMTQYEPADRPQNFTEIIQSIKKIIC